jgi:hypothetical protein
MSVRRQLDDQGWRLNNLYTITTKEGKKVPFRMNWAQQELWESLSLNNLVLKVRQLGISTFIQLLQLDTCLFNANTSCGVIAHDRESAEDLFHRNIKSPYEDLPESIRDAVTATSDTARQLRFSNGSVIRVGTSMRSGTYQILHVSEFGKICARWPDKAREIVTGSFETVPVGHGLKFVESTAEGREGYFYDYCQEARALQDAGKELGDQDWRFFFFPWWKHPEYRSRDLSTIITAERTAYFDELEKVIGEPIPLARRLWYVGKAKTLGEDMLREYPSTPDEAFAVTIQGAYYGNEMREARKAGRITKVPYQTGALVHTWWDLGMDDMTAIWFVQRIGRELHVIDYYEANSEGLAHYAKVLQDRGYLYGAHVGPHDLEVRELGGGEGEGITRKETARRLGINFTVAPGPGSVSQADGIQAVRNLLSIAWFDEEKCDKGIKCLEAYQREWNESLGTYRNTPLHNWASHACDAFRHGAIGDAKTASVRAQEVTPVSPKGWT